MAADQNKDKMEAELMNASSSSSSSSSSQGGTSSNSSSDDDDDQKDYPTGDHHDIDDDDIPETELLLQPPALLRGFKGKEKVLTQESDHHNSMKSHAKGIFGESLDLQLQLQVASKSRLHPITKPPPSPSPFKKMKPLVISTPGDDAEKAKMKSSVIMSGGNERKQPFNKKFPTFGSTSTSPDTKGKPPLMVPLSDDDDRRRRGGGDNVVVRSDDPDQYSGNLWKRAGDFSRELLTASVVVELLKHMPMVWTKGGIPDGKITKGFLFKYGMVESATIVCACHGQFFSSAEFAEHAGGRGLENPSKFINIEFFPNN